MGTRGRVGFVVPTGIATDDTTKEYFGTLISSRQLASLYDFQNVASSNLFQGIGHDNIKFALLTLGKTPTSKPEFVFYARAVSDLRDQERRFSLDASDISLLNPNTRTSPTFRCRRDADINLAMYRHAGVLWLESEDVRGNTWGVRLRQGIFNMASDASLFRTRAQLLASGCRLEGNRFLEGKEVYLPLLEAKMVHHFDHRFGDYSDRPADKDGTDTRNLPIVPGERLADPTYRPIPRYWVKQKEVDLVIGDKWSRSWFLGWRDICRSIDQRTVIASLVPFAAIGDKFLLMMPSATPRQTVCLYGNLCSFAFDYAARQKVGGTSLKYFTMKQLPVLPPATYEMGAPWQRDQSLQQWVLPRVLELTYTAWDLRGFAVDVDYEGPPFRWTQDRRFLLRCELDSAFMHLYRLSRDDAEYVMETFPVVRKNDLKAHGEYRTKRVILEIYDEMAEAADTGKPYQTRLDPPPADPRVAHPASTRPSWAKEAKP